MSQDELISSASGKKTPHWIPRITTSTCLTATIAKKYTCIYTYTQESFIKHYRTWNSKKNYDLISCSTSCSLSFSQFQFSTIMFSANFSKKLLWKNDFFTCCCNIKKVSYVNLSKAKYKMVCQKQRNSGLIWELVLPGEKKILKEWNQAFPIQISEILWFSFHPSILNERPFCYVKSGLSCFSGELMYTVCT